MTEYTNPIRKHLADARETLKGAHDGEVSDKANPWPERSGLALGSLKGALYYIERLERTLSAQDTRAER